MIYIHKILPLFLLPMGIALSLVVCGLVLRRRWLCWAGVVVLSVASMPLVGDAALRAAEGWRLRLPVAAMPEAQAIVVLSGGRVLPPGDPVSEWTDADRFFGGIDLYQAKKAPLLVFTGGFAPWQPDAKPEGEVLIPYAAALGVPRESMVSTGRVVNTDEEAHAVARLLAERLGTGTPPGVLLVTSALHMRRATALFARAGMDVVPFPVDFKVASSVPLTVLDIVPTVGSLGRTEIALREFYGTLYYRVFAH